MSKFKKSALRRTLAGSWAMRLAYGLLTLVLPSIVVAQNQNYHLCFPGVSWFAEGGTPPAIDGNIEGGTLPADPGWRGAFRYVFDNRFNGTPLKNVTVLGVADSKNLYVGFEFIKAGTSSQSDAILIGYDPTGNVADQRLLSIYPYTSGGTDNNVPPHVNPDYYVGGNAFPGGTGTTSALPSWLATSLRISTSAGGTDYLYSVELKIPLVASGQPADAWPQPSNGRFGLYLNVIRVAGSSAIEDSWPAIPDTVAATAAMVPPAANTWGLGTLSGVCNGVSVSNITANGGTSQLNLPPGVNNFSVFVQNNTVNGQTGAMDALGTPELAPQIRPKLSIGHFGIPNLNDLIKIPAPNNPAQFHDIAASSTQQYDIGPWDINAQDPLDLPKFQAEPHWCVMAELDANPPSTGPSCTGKTEQQAPWCFRANILNNAGVVNMNFPMLAQGKMYRGPIAEIATKGYPRLTGDEQIFDLQIRTLQFGALGGGRTGIENLALGATTNRIGEGLLWTVHGYRHLGQTITIQKQTYDIATNAGAFGYGLRYEGGKPDWRFQFFGENGSKLEQTPAGYRMHIKQDQVGYLNATFEGDAAAGTGGPIKAGGCTKLPGFGGADFVLVGMFVLGLMVYLPRRMQKQEPEEPQEGKAE